jgi:thiol:disulfide interchange protein
VLESPEDWVVGSPIASSEVVEKQLGDEPPIRYHEGPVTWTVPVQIPKSFQPGPTTVSGLIGFQTCSDSQCDRPVAAAFSATVEVDAGVSATAVPLAIGPADASYKKVAQRAEQSSTSLAQGQTSAGDTDTAAGAAPLKFDPSKLAAQEAVQATSLGRALIFAFLGGLILNVMPCVLPVIGLKILSFFDQAGQSRSRAFMLNFWYSLGLLSVFMVLAVLGASLSEMFTERLFGIVMASIVFAMALSLMGVWELQVPSFLGGGQAQALMQKEGVFGAFFKGVITTLLAIPCGAPLLSPALLWTDEQVRAGATHNVFLIFGVIGLGMASPYLIIGAFPELLRFLPKPGAWMDTFKKVMGYGLLVAVIWILYFLPLEDAVPTVAFLFGIWFACWLVGQVPITAADSTKVWTWVSAILVVALSYVVSFQLLVRPFTADKVARLVQAAEPDPLWQPFDRERFDQLVAAEKTIMVDFTADWCFTCKTLEATVLKTDNVRQAIEKNGVVTFMADWTNKDAEVTAMLDALKSRQVPVLAIFPAGNPLEPIVFRGGYTQQNVIDALAEAGPSVGADAVPRTAMRGP